MDISYAFIYHSTPTRATTHRSIVLYAIIYKVIDIVLLTFSCKQAVIMMVTVEFNMCYEFYILYN